MSASACLNATNPPATPKAELRGEISAKQPAWLTAAIAETVHGVRGRVKRIALALAEREGTVYEMADAHQPKPLKAWWIPTIVRETGSFAILDALEAQVGRVAIVMPRATHAAHADIASRAARVMQEAGEMLARVGASISDGTITRAERDEIHREIRDVHQVLADLAAHVDQHTAVGA